MALGSAQLARLTHPVAFAGGFNVETLSSNVTLTGKSSRFQALDPGGAHRDVTLHAVDAAADGDWYLIANRADAAENLVVKNAATSTVGTVGQDEAGLFYVDADGAWAFFGTFLYSAS